MTRARLAAPTLDAARWLLGAHLVRDDRVGRIVEVEAYGGIDDAASHARFGQTARNGIMFGPPGMAYVYLVYGMYHCLNVVTEPAGRPAAVLIRAVEPVAGIDAIRAARRADAVRRGHAAGRIEGLPASRLTSGPGLVAAGFGITGADTGLDLLDPASALRIELPNRRLSTTLIEATPRVGVDYAAEPWRSLPRRLVVRDSPSLSRA